MKRIQALFFLICITPLLYAARETLQKQPIKVGETLIIAQPSQQGSTGYSWIEVPQKKFSILQITPLEDEKPEKSMPGSTSKQRWKIKGLRRGKESFIIEERRPWEKNIEPVRVKEFVITVE